MTKYELIAKSGVINVIMDIEQQCDDRQDFYIDSTAELETGIDSILTLTEQDIVKPYIEAIKAEEMKYKGTRQVEIQAYADGLYKAIEIINNLLSQEVKNEL